MGKKEDEIIIFSTRISSSLKKQIKKLAVDTDRSVSEIVEEALIEYLKRRKYGTPKD